MKPFTTHDPDAPPDSPSRKKEFLDLFGVWSVKEEKEFNEQVSDFEKIDQEDWV